MEQVITSNWTVAYAGGVDPPKSSDYATWTIEQLRKECTQRNLQLARSTPKEARIEKLTNHDRYKRTVETSVSTDDSTNATRKSTDRCIRLINVLFSDRFCERFTSIGDVVTRQQLEIADINNGSQF